VNLTDDDIDVELTVTEFTGWHRYTFKKQAKEYNVILNLGLSINRGKPTDTYIERTGKNSFVGYRFTDGWGGPKKVFFAIEFRNEPVAFRVFDAEKDEKGKSAEGKGIKAVFTFDTKDVLFKVGISSGSIKGAVADLKQLISTVLISTG